MNVLLAVASSIETTIFSKLSFASSKKKRANYCIRYERVRKKFYELISYDHDHQNTENSTEKKIISNSILSKSFIQKYLYTP